ncbi:hypothetical protein AAIG91_35885, partial [Pseudomonas aeruginosa]|uniref:hypothetical protein n=1 Tax=Pseudomonas aeruginosa TaxID=287 RepID=UPI0031B6ABE6
TVRRSTLPGPGLDSNNAQNAHRRAVAGNSIHFGNPERCGTGFTGGIICPDKTLMCLCCPCRYGCDQNDLLSGSHNASLFTDTGNEIPGIATNHGDCVDIG